MEFSIINENDRNKKATDALLTLQKCTQSIHLDPAHRHPRNLQRHTFPNREHPTTNDDHIMHLRFPLPLHDDVVRLVRVVFAGAGDERDIVRGGDAWREGPWTVHDCFEFVGDRAAVASESGRGVGGDGERYRVGVCA